MYSPGMLMCKDETGAIIPWASAHGITFRSWRQARYSDKDSPLSRVAELFNVNHFLVSQARPYIAPFLQSDLHHPDPRRAAKRNLASPLLRLVALEIRHRLTQLDTFGLLPIAARRLLIDETVPGVSCTLVPDLNPGDFLKLLQTPTKEGLDYWIQRGERSVWPAVSSLKIRCAVEVELDRCYQLVRRRKPFDNSSPFVTRRNSKGEFKKKRAMSAEQHARPSL